MTGECSLCGLTGIPVVPLPPWQWLNPRVQEFMCLDPQACKQEYDRITRVEGWLW